ncbi:DUF4123 domain-containing protein [Pseudomonas fulva]|uniref:DUF4123 domain-containing protein n=1 Tax=Pseudomonas fulva TaxID=47880 RepID=UPI00201D96F5|nr:DUF4123 domain-containing protein [Pseudomonas fulva]UQY36809.1 DUF4123 domain-containing protein [Pseudomonas fulva]
MTNAGAVASLCRRLPLDSLNNANRLYALVDGARYLTLDKRLADAAGSIQFQWLLAGSELDEISHAGPALVEFSSMHASANGFLDWLIARDKQSPLVSWLWSGHPFTVMAEHHRCLLFTQMPDGRRSLFRYYNPQVRRALEQVVTPGQRQQLMRHVSQWQIWQPLQSGYLSYEGQDVEAGDV